MNAPKKMFARFKKVVFFSRVPDNYITRPGPIFKCSSIVLGFFESELPATMQRRHSFLHAVKKWTREVTTLGRERGCYLGIREREMENTSVFRCT